MLSKSELENIPKYSSLSPRDKKNLNYRIKDKISNIKNVLAEINLLLTLPENFIKEHLENDTLIESLKVTERILQIIDPWPIEEHEKGGLWAFKNIGQRSSEKPGECFIRTTAWTATNEEIAINHRLKDHLTTLQHYVDPYLIDPVCCNPGEFLPSEDEIIKALREGTRSTVENSNYFRGWRGEDGLVYREPVTLREEELKFKRWNPRGLPKKYDVPEQPEEPTYKYVHTLSGSRGELILEGKKEEPK